MDGHIRGRRKGGYTTDPGHMPAAHRAHLEWTPSRLVRWTRKTGPRTADFARAAPRASKGLAELHLDATIEDLNFKANRSLDRSLILRLASGQRIKDGQTVLVTGATGSRMSYLDCALGHQACRNSISTRYFRVSRLLDALVLNDWGLASLSGQNRHDLLEVLDDRYVRRGTILASQLPVEHWHDVVDDPPSETPSSTGSSTTPIASLARVAP